MGAVGWVFGEGVDWLTSRLGGLRRTGLGATWGRRWRKERGQAMQSLGEQNWVDKAGQTEETGPQLEAVGPWVLLEVDPTFYRVDGLGLEWVPTFKVRDLKRSL